MLLLSQLCPHSFGGLLGRNPPWKRFSECFLSSYCIVLPKRGFWPNTKKWGGVPPPAHSQFLLISLQVHCCSTK
jgi:hypothetical protein